MFSAEDPLVEDAQDSRMAASLEKGDLAQKVVTPRRFRQAAKYLQGERNPLVLSGCGDGQKGSRVASRAKQLQDLVPDPACRLDSLREGQVQFIFHVIIPRCVLGQLLLGPDLCFRTVT